MIVTIKREKIIVEMIAKENPGNIEEAEAEAMNVEEDLDHDHFNVMIKRIWDLI